jgi:hypothetical protein
VARFDLFVRVEPLYRNPTIARKLHIRMVLCPLQPRKALHQVLSFSKSAEMAAKAPSGGPQGSISHRSAGRNVQPKPTLGWVVRFLWTRRIHINRFWAVWGGLKKSHFARTSGVYTNLYNIQLYMHTIIICILYIYIYIHNIYIYIIYIYIIYVCIHCVHVHTYVICICYIYIYVMYIIYTISYIYNIYIYIYIYINICI